MKVSNQRQTFRTICPTCGHPWNSTDSFTTGSVTDCPCCVYLEMVRCHANRDGLTLREAVRRYLLGMVKKHQTRLSEVWTGIFQ